MYVCVCNAVTESDIEKAVNQGCNSLRQLEDKTGAASQCGSCVCDVAACLQRSLEDDLRDMPLLNI